MASASHCARIFGEIPPRGTDMSPPTVDQPVPHATQTLDSPQRACRELHQSAGHTLRLVRLLLLVPLRDRETQILRKVLQEDNFEEGRKATEGNQYLDVDFMSLITVPSFPPHPPKTCAFHLKCIHVWSHFVT